MQFNGGYGDYDPEYDSDYDPEYDNEIDPETETEIDPEHEGDQSIIRTEVYDTEGHHKGSYIGVVQEIDSESIDDLVDETDDEIDDEIESVADDETPKDTKYGRNKSGKNIRELTDEEFERIYPDQGHRVFWGSKGRGRVIMEEEEKRKKHEEEEWLKHNRNR